LHSLKQLRNGVRDFCQTLDQVGIGFFWHYVLRPKFEDVPVSATFRPNETLQVIENATIESSLLSIRILDEFFSDENIRPNDIRAAHYIGFTSPDRFLSKFELTRSIPRVAHLTTQRDSSEDPWQIVPLIERAYGAAKPFLSYLISDAGAQFQPAGPIFVSSRLEMCQTIGPLIKSHLERIN